MNTKTFVPLLFKTLDDVQGTFTGDANVTGIVDLGGDRILAGAFLKDLMQRGPRRPLLWGHDSKEIIGIVDLAENVVGPRTSLRVTCGQLALGVQRAREAYELLKIPGAIGGMSIGFDFNLSKTRVTKEGVREIAEASVFEVSLVYAPMNQESFVDSVKSRATADEAELLASLNRLHATIKSFNDSRDPMDRFGSTLRQLAAKLAA